MEEFETQTYRCAPNIALIKYWGKLEKDTYNLPLNSSLSLTLDPSLVTSDTKITLTSCPGIHFLLNGKEEKLTKAHHDAIKFFLPNLEKDGKGRYTKGLNIESHNNFPTAAGMASSASGFAAFACCLAKVVDYFEVGVSAEGGESTQGQYFIGDQVAHAVLELWKILRTQDPEISEDIAEKAVRKGLRAIKFVALVRRLSGSACRSIFRGYSIFRGPELIIDHIIESFKSKNTIDAESFLKSFFFNFGATNLDNPFTQNPTISMILQRQFQILLQEADSNPNSLDTYFESMLDRYYDQKLGKEVNVSLLKFVLHLLCNALPLDTICQMQNKSVAFLEQITTRASVFACVLKATPKDIPSKAGMTSSSLTSDFLVYRVKTLESRIQTLLSLLTTASKPDSQSPEATLQEIFALLSKDSNSFHAVCQDSTPPIRYISDGSLQLSGKLLEWFDGRGGCGVTFDAGENPFVFCVRGLAGQRNEGLVEQTEEDSVQASAGREEEWKKEVVRGLQGLGVDQVIWGW